MFVPPPPGQAPTSGWSNVWADLTSPLEVLQADWNYLTSPNTVGPESLTNIVTGNLSLQQVQQGVQQEISDLITASGGKMSQADAAAQASTDWGLQNYLPTAPGPTSTNWTLIMLLALGVVAAIALAK